MSWQVFMQKCNAELGGGTQDKEQFVKKLMKEYHASIQRHVDVISGGGKFSNLTPDPVIKLLQVWAELNLLSPAAVMENVNFLDNMKFVVPIYFIAGVAVGPNGTSVITFPGIWLPVELKPNFNFMVMLTKISLLSTLHVKTLLGTFTSSTTGLVTPWSGTALQTVS